MTQEFDLSKKGKRSGEAYEFDKVVYTDIDVKDFIRRLKESVAYRFQGGHSSVKDIVTEEIDKLAGDKLK